MGDDIRMANQTTVGRTTEAFIHGLQFDTIYKLRMMAFNRGGDGKKSPTVYFTVEKGNIPENQQGDVSSNRKLFICEQQMARLRLALFIRARLVIAIGVRTIYEKI